MLIELDFTVCNIVERSGRRAKTSGFLFGLRTSRVAIRTRKCVPFSDKLFKMFHCIPSTSIDSERMLVSQADHKQSSKSFFEEWKVRSPDDRCV